MSSTHKPPMSDFCGASTPAISLPPSLGKQWVGYIWADLSPPPGSQSTRSRPRALWPDIGPRQEAVFLQAVSPLWHRVKHPQLSAARKLGQVFLCSLASNSAIPWTAAHQAPLSMGFSRQEYWNGTDISSSRDLPGPGIKPASSVSPILQAGSLPLSRCGEGQGDQWRNQSGKAPSRLLQQKAKLSSKKNKRREGKHEKRGEEERSHKHLWNKGIFPNVKCTDNLMEFTWFSPFRVWLQKIELQSHHHILDLLQLTCRQEKRTVTSTLRSHGYILNRGGTQTGIQDKLFPSSRKRSCDWAALFNRQIRQ